MGSLFDSIFKTSTIGGFNISDIANAASVGGKLFSGYQGYQANNQAGNAKIASIGDVDRMLALNLEQIGKDTAAITKLEEFNIAQNAKRKRVANEIASFNRTEFGLRRTTTNDEFSLRNQLSDLDRTRISTDLTEAMKKLDLSETARKLKRDRTVADQRVAAGAGGVRLTGSQRAVRDDLEAEAQLDLDAISAERTGMQGRADLNLSQVDTQQDLFTVQHEFGLQQLSLQEQQSELDLVNAVEDIDLDLDTLRYNAEIARERKRTEARIANLNASAQRSNLSANASAYKSAGRTAAVGSVINAGSAFFGQGRT